MDSKVKSQISDKVYEATLDDLSEADQGLEVDLYKLNVFNKDIMIAPGKVITDAKKDVHYCYVYVIKDGRVAAKLGVYETHAMKGDVYDLTDFEGREFLLFDHYYNEPGSLVQFEMQEEKETDNIFDYLKRFLKPVTNATAAIKEQRDMIRKITKRTEGNPKATALKLFRKQKPYDEDWMDSLKEEREDWMFILIVLEIVFNVKFVFEDSDGSEDELRELVRAPANAKEPTSVIRVSLEDTPRHIVDAPKSKSNAKTALVVESDSDSEEEFKPKDEFPSPDNEDTPLAELKTKPDLEEFEPIATFKPRSFTSKKPEVQSFSSKKPEEKPVRSFSSKKPETVQSLSSKKPEVRSFSSKKPILDENLPLPPSKSRAVSPSKPSTESPPKPRAVSPSVRKSTAESRAVSPSVKSAAEPSPEPRAVSPSVRKSSVVSPSKPIAEEPGVLSKLGTASGEKPRSRIVRSAPPPKLKTLGENNA